MEKEKNNLVGKWQMICWKVNAPGGWKMLKKFTEGQYLWDFGCDGKLNENIVGEQPQHMEYSLSAENLLMILRREKDNEDKSSSAIEERYRLEFLIERYVILYDLEEVTVEPDDYTLKIEMEKV